jgi:phage shock protein E
MNPYFKTLILLSYATLNACSVWELSENSTTNNTQFESRSENIDLTTLQKSGALIVDVRTPEEFAKGHFKTAINIPHTLITSSLQKVGSNKQKTIVLYCKSGRRAEVAKQELMSLGYQNVINAGGFPEY